MAASVIHKHHRAVHKHNRGVDLGVGLGQYWRAEAQYQELIDAGLLAVRVSDGLTIDRRGLSLMRDRGVLANHTQLQWFIPVSIPVSEGESLFSDALSQIDIDALRKDPQVQQELIDGQRTRLDEYIDDLCSVKRAPKPTRRGLSSLSDCIFTTWSMNALYYFAYRAVMYARDKDRGLFDRGHFTLGDNIPNHINRLADEHIQNAKPTRAFFAGGDTSYSPYLEVLHLALTGGMGIFDVSLGSILWGAETNPVPVVDRRPNTQPLQASNARAESRALELARAVVNTPCGPADAVDLAVWLRHQLTQVTDLVIEDPARIAISVAAQVWDEFRESQS